MTRPRKKAVITTYGELNKEKIKDIFDPLWDSIKDSKLPCHRIQLWNVQVRTCWEKEDPEVQNQVIKQTDEENEEQLAAWEAKASSFTSSPEDLIQ